MKYPKSPMLFDCFDPDCGAALILAVAEALSSGLDANQMNVLGTFLTAVADTISYMAAQISYNKEICAPKEDTENGDTKDEGSIGSDGSDNKNDSKDNSGVNATANKKAGSTGHEDKHEHKNQTD